MIIEKFPVENGEAICCFGEAIVHLDYSVSSAPFVSKETLRVEFRDWSKDKQEPSLTTLITIGQYSLIVYLCIKVLK